MQPDVSFIVAAYNAEATIARAISSALAQTDVSVEVVVADDRSSDNTVAIARSFPQPQVRVVSLEENRGPGGARNAALGEARGRWLAVLDADDVMRPERIARMIALAQAAGAEAAVDNLEVFNEATQTQEIMFTDTFLAGYPTLSLADYIASNVLFKSTFNFGYMKPILSRAFVENRGLRYEESLRVGEDYVFLASAMAKGARCLVDPRAGYVYHIREGSISRVLEARHVAAMIEGDVAFEREHVLDEASRQAFDRRRRSLEEAASFLAIVDHLKAGSPFKAMRVALRDPAAVRHLRMPIAVRFRRIAEPFTATRHF